MKYDRALALKRTKAFMLNEKQKGILARCEAFDVKGTVPVPALETLSLPQDYKKYMDAVIHNFLRNLEAHTQTDDDYLPSLRPFLGIAEHSCFMGGEVKYGGNTSYQEPAFDDMTQWRQLKLDRARPHYALLMDCMAYLKEKADEYGFYASLRGFDGPMDIANAIRGNDILYDFYDEEEETQAFTDFCADGTLWNFENQRPLVTDVEGGVISGFGLWLPGRAIGHLSEDASCLCSVEMYRKFGLPYMQKVMSHFDSGLLHVHSLGRRCIPEFRKIPQFKIMEISSDPNQPTGLEVYREYEEALDGIAVFIELDCREVKENLDFLKNHRTIVTLRSETLREAQETLELLRG